MSGFLEIKYKKLGSFKILRFGYSIYFKYFKFFFVPYLVLFIAPQEILKLLERVTRIPLSQYYIVDISCRIYFFVLAPCYIAGIVAIITKQVVTNGEIRFKPIVKKVTSNLFSLPCMTVGFYLKAIIGLLLLIAPGVHYILSKQFYLEALMLSDKEGNSAFDYSKTITTNNLLRIFRVLILLLIQYCGLHLILKLPFALFITFSEPATVQFSILTNVTFQKFTSIYNLLLSIVIHNLEIILCIASTLLFLNLEYFHLLRRKN